MNRTLLIMLVSLLPAQASFADFTYQLDALPGDVAGTKLSGYVVLPDSSAGLTVWEVGSIATDFHFEADYGSGLVFDVLFSDRSSQFDAGIGAAILSPVLPDVSSGAPDFAFANNPLPNLDGDFVLGLGLDAGGTSEWNLVETGTGNVDFVTRASGSAIPAWRLILVPEPASLLLLGLSTLSMFGRPGRIR